MPIILPILRDPTDIVIQGEQIIPPVSLPIYSPVAMTALMEGEFGALDELPIMYLPPNLVGQSDWYGILPRQIGPMVFGQAGMIGMLDIGQPKFVSPNIDPIQKLLNDPFPIDITGMWFDLTPDLLGAFEATNSRVFPATEPLGTPVVNIPRGAISRSGIIKNTTLPILPTTVGQHMMEYYTESTQKWFISGATMNSSGVPIGGCRIVVLQTNKIGYNPDAYSNPVIGETISDGDGNYSIQVDYESFQVLAYLPGSPDLAGVTINTITPTLG
jgi:hypothetical protein